MNRTVRNVLLTIFLLTPAVMVSLFLLSIRAPTTLPPPSHSERPPGPRSGEKFVAPESLAQGFIILVEDKTGASSDTSPIYITGTMNQWNPRDEAFHLARQPDGRWRISMNKPPGPLEFRFTRGSSELVELDAGRLPRPARKLATVDVNRLAPGQKPVIELSVEAWADQKPVPPALAAPSPK